MSYATLADFKAYLKIPAATTSEDTLLQQFLNEASGIVDEIIDGPAAASVNTTRVFDDPTLVDGAILLFGRGEVACAVSTITNGDGVAVANTTYRLLPHVGPPYYGAALKPSSGRAWITSGDGVEITGLWANTTNANGTADPLIVGATLQLAAWLYRSKDNVTELTRPVRTDDGTTILPMALPKAVLDRLIARRALP